MNDDLITKVSPEYLNSYNEIASQAEILKSFFGYFSESSQEKVTLNVKDDKFFSLPLILLISHTYFGALASYNARSFTNVAFSSRHLFECLLICKEISLDNTAAERWYNFGKLQQLKLITTNPSFYEENFVRNAATEIKIKYSNISNLNKKQRESWNLDNLNIIERAKKHSLEKEYVKMYKDSCFISHPSSSFEIYIKDGLNDLFYQLMIRLNFCILYSTRSIEAINNIYNVDIDYNNIINIIQKVGGIISKLKP